MTDHTKTNAEILKLGAVQAVAAMQRGDITAEAYATILLTQAERWSSLNAFRTLDRDVVLNAARTLDTARKRGKTLGRLHGLPIPVKDSINTSSLPTSNGTLSLKDFKPKADADIIKLLMNEGAIIMGKTNLHEISFGWTSDNGTFGPVHNPYNIVCSPGGSSGGSAVAVSARMAPLAVAEDTWGSIRLPASFCGLVGFRPSRGRYPNDGVMPLTKAFDQIGPLARVVEDLILFDQMAAGNQQVLNPPPLRKARIAVPAVLWEGLDPEVERIARNGINRLRESGASILEITTQIKDIDKASEIVGTIVSYELKESISNFLREQNSGITFDDLYTNLASNTKSLMDDMVLPPHTPSQETYEDALARCAALTSEITVYMHDQGIQALVFPTAMIRAPKIGEEMEVMIDDGRKLGAFDAFGRNVALGSCAGMTSLVLCAGLANNGLPVGLEFAGVRGHDRALLALGLSLEKEFDAFQPPTI